MKFISPVLMALLLGSMAVADSPKGLGPPEVAINAPSGWKLNIHADGSAYLRYRDHSGIGYKSPAGTFKTEDVLKAMAEAKPNPRVPVNPQTHYQFWFESERKQAFPKPPPLHYTQDEKVVVPLFEKAAERAKVKDSLDAKALIDSPFPLPLEAKRYRMFAVHSPGSWFLDINNDGSGYLQFGSSGGDGCSFPVSTFKMNELQKLFDGLKYDAKIDRKNRFGVCYEEERKSPSEGPKLRLTSDAKSLVPLFERAAKAGKLKERDRGRHLLTDRPFDRE